MYTILSVLLRCLSLYLGLTASLFAMSFVGNQSAAGFYARLLASYGSLVLCAFYGVLASIALRLVGYHRIAQWATARSFKYTMRYSTGVRFDIISGKEHLKTRPAVFVGNHQTALDVLMLGEIFPRWCSVTAKKSLMAVPFLGWFMALSGTVFIDRTNRSTALKAFEGAAKEMREKRQSVFIFPEGTRSNAEEPMMLDFKKGGFHLAIQAGVPIVPVITACYFGVLSVREKRFRGGSIPVIVLPPIPTHSLTASDAEDLTRRTRDIMLEALLALTGTPLGQAALHPDGVIPKSVAKSTTSSVSEKVRI